MKWSELVDRIEQFHAPIKHHFFTGAGMWLMREDSDLAETIMFEYFEAPNQFCLPIHDSFIVHWSWATDLKQRMVEVFQKKYGVTPKIKVIKRKSALAKGPPELVSAKDFTHEQICDAMNQPHIIRTDLFKACNGSN